MKLIATSDLHGHLPQIEEEFDLLLICGDVCPAHDHYYSFQKEWLENEFIDWINTLPYRNPYSKVVMIGGNHDFGMERLDKDSKFVMSYRSNSRLIMLKNEVYNFEYLGEHGNFETLKIFGTPYCKIFGNWAFMVSDDTLRKKYSQCPDNVDIIISHDAANLNGLGTIDYGTSYSRNVGNIPLAELVEEKKPRFYFCGHIHSGNHHLEFINDATEAANVSLVDEAYDATFEPLIIEI